MNWSAKIWGGGDFGKLIQPSGFSDLPTALFQIMHKEMDSLVFFSLLCLSAVLSHSYALLYIHKVRFNPVLYLLLCTVFCMYYLLIRLLYLWSGFKQPRLEQFKNVLASDLTLYLTRWHFQKISTYDVQDNCTRKMLIWTKTCNDAILKFTVTKKLKLKIIKTEGAFSLEGWEKIEEKLSHSYD